jgi:hypothetical protein
MLPIAKAVPAFAQLAQFRFCFSLKLCAAFLGEHDLAASYLDWRKLCCASRKYAAAQSSEFFSSEVFFSDCSLIPQLASNGCVPAKFENDALFAEYFAQFLITILHIPIPNGAGDENYESLYSPAFPNTPRSAKFRACCFEISLCEKKLPFALPDLCCSITAVRADVDTVLSLTANSKALGRTNLRFLLEEIATKILESILIQGDEGQRFKHSGISGIPRLTRQNFGQKPLRAYKILV